MISLFNERSKLKPDMVITTENYERLGDYLPIEQKEEILQKVYYYIVIKGGADLFIFHNPDHFNGILALRDIRHTYDDYLPNYKITIKDDSYIIYGEDLIFGSQEITMINNSIINRALGSYFNKNNIYIVATDSTMSISTSKLNISDSVEHNMFIYIPKNCKKNNL